MIYHPHEYQRYAVNMLITHPNAGLFLDMGLGKSVITLTAIDELMYDRFEVNRVLIIAPLSVARFTWTAEAAKWRHLSRLRLSLVLGSESDRIAALNADADIYVINRENVVWLVGQLGKNWKFDMVVADELSSFKSHAAKRFKALKRVRKHITRFVGLTGTPAPNGYMDLWAQAYLIDGGERLGKTITGYRERYFTPGRRNGNVVYDWLLKEGAAEAIRDRLSDVCVSMKASDYIQLPDRIDVTVPVTLSPEERRLYSQMERDRLIELKGSEITAFTASAAMNKLLQLANGGVYTDAGKAVTVHGAKLTALKELIEAVQGSPVLVYYAYTFDRDSLLANIDGAEELDPTGWNAGRQRVAIAHPAAAGYGLNLQAGGHIIVWYGLTWNLEMYQQANARLYRQGQTEPVRICHLVTQGTVDEQVMTALQTKATGQNALMDALKQRISEVEQ